MGMRRRYRGFFAVPTLVLVLALSGCESFDPAYLFPDSKKKLPGERREVFPGGNIPGVTQGIPPEMIRGSPAQQAAQQPAAVQQPATAVQQAQPEPSEEEKPKARPRPKKQAARPAPAQAEPAQPAPAQAGAWPAPQQRPPQAAQQAPAPSAWPSPPASGTFTR